MLSLRAKTAAVAVAAASLLTGLVGSPAQAAGSPYSLAYLHLGDGRTIAQRWNPCQVITYKVNLGAVPASGRAAALAETQQAVAKVAAATGLTFGYRGATSEVPRQHTDHLRQSAEIIIAWVTPAQTDLPLRGSSVGYGGHVAYSWWTAPSSTAKRTWSGATVRGYLVLNAPALRSSERLGFGARGTQGNVILHELGHVVGLGHVSDPHQLMYPQLNVATPNGYAAGDRAGLALLGRRAGCISVPSWVAADLK